MLLLLLWRITSGRLAAHRRTARIGTLWWLLLLKTLLLRDKLLSRTWWTSRSIVHRSVLRSTCWRLARLADWMTIRLTKTSRSRRWHRWSYGARNRRSIRHRRRTRLLLLLLLRWRRISTRHLTTCRRWAHHRLGLRRKVRRWSTHRAVLIRNSRFRWARQRHRLHLISQLLLARLHSIHARGLSGWWRPSRLRLNCLRLWPALWRILPIRHLGIHCRGLF